MNIFGDKFISLSYENKFYLFCVVFLVFCCCCFQCVSRRLFNLNHTSSIVMIVFLVLLNTRECKRKKKSKCLVMMTMTIWEITKLIPESVDVLLFLNTKKWEKTSFQSFLDMEWARVKYFTNRFLANAPISNDHFLLIYPSTFNSFDRCFASLFPRLLSNNE